MAYEADFHYGLTKWLAIQAGVCEERAEIVATGTLAPDQQHDAVALTKRALLHGDVAAAREVQEWHFPSDGPVPGLPQARRVKPGSAAAWRKVEQVTASRSSRLLDDLLRQFGEALHPLQDSWSHRGVPGIPVQLLGVATSSHDPETIGWGHPDNRGGWNRRIADQTYLDPVAATDAAEATYRALTSFLAAHPDAKCHVNSPVLEFAKLRQDVLQFAEASTIAAKKQWFVNKKLSIRQTELDDLSLSRR